MDKFEIYVWITIVASSLLLVFVIDSSISKIRYGCFNFQINNSIDYYNVSYTCEDMKNFIELNLNKINYIESVNKYCKGRFIGSVNTTYFYSGYEFKAKYYAQCLMGTKIE